MAGNSSSVSQNTSQSQSTTGVLDYPERAFLDAIAQYAGQVGSNVYNWAQGEYAKNSSLTDANIHNYLNTSSQALGMAQNDVSRYQQKFQPEEDQLLQDANSYASPNRVMLEMGQAESGQMQAADASRQNAIRDLESYGIDPSSGRYAALDRASQVSAGAAAAGAAQQARQNTEAVGRDLRSQAVQVGSQYPGRAIASMNTALQGFAGAENAGLANANTGVALQGAANPFLNTAASYKPVTGTNSSSASQGTSQSGSTSTDPPSSSKSSDPSKSGSGTGSDPNGVTNYGGGSGGASGGGFSGSNQTDVGGGGGNTDANGTSTGDVWSGGSGTDYTGTDSNPFSSAYPTDSIGGGYDPTSQSSLDSYSSGSFGDYYPQSSGSGDYSGVTDYGGSGDAGFAEGGAIDDDTGAIPEDGGQIPQSASPSGGQQVDDIRAQGPRGPINVNANEFVIPQDVALWKGQEFFQKLIAQSRQARVMAPAKPSRAAAPAQGMN